MKHFYHKDDLSIWDRRTNEKIGGATTLENALLITDVLNDELLFREKARLQANRGEQRPHLDQSDLPIGLNICSLPALRHYPKR